jgi:hypothetical protein
MDEAPVANCEAQCCYKHTEKPAKTGCVYVYVPVGCYPKTEYEDLSVPRVRKDEEILTTILDNLASYKGIMAENEVWNTVDEKSLNPAELDLKMRQKSELALINTTEDMLTKLRNSKRVINQDGFEMVGKIKGFQESLKTSMSFASSTTASYGNIGTAKGTEAQKEMMSKWSTDVDPMASFRQGDGGLSHSGKYLPS